MEEGYAAARYVQAAALLPQRLKKIALTLPLQAQARAEELRLRPERPLSVLLDRGETPLDSGEEAVVRQEDLETVCNLVTGFSRYAAAETLKKGYLTAEGGFRVGVCGSAVEDGGRITMVKNFSSMAIRIAREKPGLAAELSGELFENGGFCSTLILAPPGFGKTTLLRDLIRCLSLGVNGRAPLRVSLADERGEIAVLLRGVPQMDVGPHTDVLEGCDKAQGMELLLRVMNPEVIAVDEITAFADLRAMERAGNCGVKLLATIHAASISELQQKPLFQKLLRLRVFEKAVVISLEAGERRYRVEAMA